MVQVPFGVVAGQRIRVRTAAGEVDVLVPPGVQGGQQIMIQL
jgi:hypothetical protein